MILRCGCFITLLHYCISTEGTLHSSEKCHWDVAFSLRYYSISRSFAFVREVTKCWDVSISLICCSFPEGSKVMYQNLEHSCAGWLFFHIKPIFLCYSHCCRCHCCLSSLMKKSEITILKQAAYMYDLWTHSERKASCNLSKKILLEHCQILKEHHAVWMLSPRPFHPCTLILIQLVQGGFFNLFASPKPGWIFLCINCNYYKI